MVIDYHTLRDMGHQNPVVITDDRDCAGCGYNLKGLLTNGTCPECARPIDAARYRPRHAGQMVDAPEWWVRLFGVGVLLMMLAAILALFAAPLAGVGGPVVGAIGAAAASLIWCAGVWMATITRPASSTTLDSPRVEWCRVRLAARLGSCAFVLAGVMALALATIGTPPTWAVAIVTAVALLGFAGLPVVTLYLSRIAEWAADQDLALKLNVGTWLLLVVTPVGLAMLCSAVFARGAVGAMSGPLFAMGTLILLITGLYFVVCLILVNAMVTWAGRGIEARQDRLERLAQGGTSSGVWSCQACGHDLDLALGRCPECGHLDQALRGAPVVRRSRRSEVDLTAIPLD